MALYLICGSQQHDTYQKLARAKLSSLLSLQPALGSLCAVEALDNNRLPHSGLLLLSEDDTAATDGACELLQKLNLTVAPLIVQSEWQEDCLPGLLLFECPSDPGDKYISDLRAKHLNIVACHRLSFTRRQRGLAEAQAKQFQVLMVQLSGGPQALNFERNLLARLICNELHLQQALYAKLSRPELADNPPYVPTVETRCLKTTFLLVRGSHSYERAIKRAFNPSFVLKHESGKHNYFVMLYSIRKHPAATSIPERRYVMDKLMNGHPNCRVDEVYVCQLDSASCRSPSVYAAPPVGVQCSNFLLIATDPWGPSETNVRDACCGISMSSFFTDGFSRMALINFPNQNDKISSSLALIAQGVEVYAVFLNDWIVNVELLPAGPLRQPTFSQSVRPDVRSLVLHGPSTPTPSEPRPKLQSPKSLKPTKQPSEARPSLLPTPEPQPSPAPILSTSAQQLPSASPSPPPSPRPEEQVSAGPTTASSMKRPASEALPGSPTRLRRRDQSDASASEPDPIDLDLGSPMSIQTEDEAGPEDGEISEAGETIANASPCGFGGGPRTPPESPENRQRSRSVLSTVASSASNAAASASSGPKPPPEPHLRDRSQAEPEGGLMNNMCLEVSPLSVHVTRYDVEQLLQEHRNPNGEDWHFVLYIHPGRDFQQLLLFAENPGAELCRSLVFQLRSGRSSRLRLPPPCVNRRSIRRSEAGARCPLPLRLAVFFEPRGLWLCGLRPGQLDNVLACMFGRYRQVQTTDYQQQSVLLRFDNFGDCINSYLRVSITQLYRLACYLCLGCD